MTFDDFTVTAAGRIRSHRQHESSSLEPAAVEIFAQMLQRYGLDFQHAIPVDGMDHIELSWTQEHPGAAMATFWAKGVPLTTSVLIDSEFAIPPVTHVHQCQP